MEKSITHDELEDLLKRYNIGKKPLSLLLGWGETTILIYLRSERVPFNEYTCHLKRLYDNPLAFYKLLEENKDHLRPVAYRKCLDAVRSILPNTDIIKYADYIASRIERSNESVIGAGNSHDYFGAEHLLKLETVLFWSQVFALNLNGEALFEDDCQPGKTGLPYKSVEEIYQKYETWPHAHGSDLDPESKEAELIDTVIGVFDWYGPAALNMLMKAERNRLCGAPGARKRSTVSNVILRKCYGEVFKQAKVHKLKDIDGYIAKRMAFIKKNPPQ